MKSKSEKIFELESMVDFYKEELASLKKVNKELTEQLRLHVVSQCFAIKEPIIIDAMEACLSVGYASTSLFTRRLNVPYKTAMKIMDTLEDNKMVGMFNGTAKRELMLNDVEFKKLLKQNCC